MRNPGRATFNASRKSNGPSAPTLSVPVGSGVMASAPAAWRRRGGELLLREKYRPGRRHCQPESALAARGLARLGGLQGRRPKPPFLLEDARPPLCFSGTAVSFAWGASSPPRTFPLTGTLIMISDSNLFLRPAPWGLGPGPERVQSIDGAITAAEM